MNKVVKKVLDKTDVDEKLGSAMDKIRQEVRKNIATAILAAFAFIIALVWKDVITDGVNALVAYMNMSGSGFTFTIISALITTVICVVGILYFSRWGEKK